MPTIYTLKQQPLPRNLVNLQREHTALRSRIDRLVPAVTQALVRLRNENLKLKKQFDELNAKLERQQRSVQKQEVKEPDVKEPDVKPEPRPPVRQQRPSSNQPFRAKSKHKKMNFVLRTVKIPKIEGLP